VWPPLPAMFAGVFFVVWLSAEAFLLHGGARVGLAPLAAQQPGIKVGSDRFTLVYTCGKCDTRNVVRVKRVAWEKGVVIGKCFGCGATHLLADNSGKMDVTNMTQFKNAFDDAKLRGIPAQRLDASDPAALAAAGIELLPDGNVSLTVRDGDTPRLDPETGRVVALTRNETAAPPELATSPVDEPQAAATSPRDEQPANTIELVREDAPTIELPEGVGPGGVLKIQTPAGQLIHLSVPDGSGPGSKLVVNGIVEVRVPAGATDQDVLSVTLPDNSTVPVLLTAEDVLPDSVVAVGYPVDILQ